jgi:hypothetical protein
MQTILVGLLEDVSGSFWFQQDGALSRYGEDVQQWLKATYSEMWIGREGTVA